MPCYRRMWTFSNVYICPFKCVTQFVRCLLAGTLHWVLPKRYSLCSFNHSLTYSTHRVKSTWCIATLPCASSHTPISNSQSPLLSLFPHIRSPFKGALLWPSWTRLSDSDARKSVERGVWNPQPDRSRDSRGGWDEAVTWRSWQMLASVTFALLDRSRVVSWLLTGKHLYKKHVNH